MARVTVLDEALGPGISNRSEGTIASNFIHSQLEYNRFFKVSDFPGFTWFKPNQEEGLFLLRAALTTVVVRPESATHARFVATPWSAHRPRPATAQHTHPRTHKNTLSR